MISKLAIFIKLIIICKLKMFRYSFVAVLGLMGSANCMDQFLSVMDIEQEFGTADVSLAAAADYLPNKCVMMALPGVTFRGGTAWAGETHWSRTSGFDDARKKAAKFVTTPDLGATWYPPENKVIPNQVYFV